MAATGVEPVGGNSRGVRRDGCGFHGHVGNGRCGVGGQADPGASTGGYTPEAWARIEHFRKYYDLSRGPTSFCVIEGMPYNMTARGRFYLTDIYQNRDRVTILFEFEDNYRIVYLDGRSLPEAWVPSANGFSSGHWEGETPHW